MIEVPLTRGLIALVDDEDEWITDFSWRAIPRRIGPGWYAARGKQTEYMHRVIMDPPPGLLVHHLNEDSLDNRRENLEIQTYDEHNELHKHALGRGKHQRVT